MKSRTPNRTMNKTPRRAIFSSLLLLLTSAFLSACAGHQPRPVASYSSALHSSESEPRQLAVMSDQDAKKQPAGTVKKEPSATSQSTTKRGKLQKQETEVTEVIETDISSVIETTTAPTADQDIQ